MPKKNEPLSNKSGKKDYLDRVRKVFNFRDRFQNKIQENIDLKQDLNTGDQVKSASLIYQVRYLPKFLSSREKAVVIMSALVIFLCLVMIGYLFWRDNIIDKPALGGVYTEAIVGAPQKINPLYASANEADRDLASLIFSGLVKFGPDNGVVPDLAKDWFVDDTETKYTFRLRDDVQWPDGKAFSSEDVVFTFNAIQNSDYQSPLRQGWEGISVRAVDEYTVQFELPEPFTPFLSSLTVGIMPSHLWQDVRPENALLAQLNIEPVGLGPYKFESYSRDKQGYIKTYNLVRNENYHLGQVFIKQVSFKFYPNFELAVDALKNKNTDGINFLPGSLGEFLQSRKDLDYYTPSLPQYTAIFFNQDKNDLLKIKNFRKALLLAIDEEEIISTVLDGQGNIISGPILPGVIGYNSAAPKGEFNIDEAKNLLDSLGWKKIEVKIEQPTDEINMDENRNDKSTSTEEDIIDIDSDGFSNYLYKDGVELSLNLTLADQPQSIAVGEMIQNFWQSVGVRTNLQIIESKQIQKQAINSRDYEALLFGEILGADPDPYAFWHSSQVGAGGLNLANFKNKEVDDLLEKARQETDVDKRAEYYQMFETIIIQNIPAIFLYNPNYTYVVSNKVKGIELDWIVTPTDRLGSISGWYIRTKKGLK